MSPVSRLPPPSLAIPPSMHSKMHTVRESEFGTHYSPALFAVLVGGLLLAGAALFVTGHYMWGIIAIALGVLPFFYRGGR